jgi:hypothetical protein
MDTLPSVEGPNSVGGDNVWFNGADGERQAIRVDSRDTQAAYSMIESVAEPGCAAPTHDQHPRWNRGYVPLCRSRQSNAAPGGFRNLARTYGRGSGQVRTGHSWPSALTAPAHGKLMRLCCSAFHSFIGCGARSLDQKCVSDSVHAV